MENGAEAAVLHTVPVCGEVSPGCSQELHLTGRSLAEQ